MGSDRWALGLLLVSFAGFQRAQARLVISELVRVFSIDGIPNSSVVSKRASVLRIGTTHFQSKAVVLSECSNAVKHLFVQHAHVSTQVDERDTKFGLANLQVVDVGAQLGLAALELNLAAL